MRTSAPTNREPGAGGKQVRPVASDLPQLGHGRIRGVELAGLAGNDLDDVDHAERSPRHRASRSERPSCGEMLRFLDGQVQPSTPALPWNHVIDLGRYVIVTGRLPGTS